MKHSHLAALMALCLTVTLSTAPVFAEETGQENHETQETAEVKEPAAEEGTDAEEVPGEAGFDEAETDDAAGAEGSHQDAGNSISKAPDRESSEDETELPSADIEEEQPVTAEEGTEEVSEKENAGSESSAGREEAAIQEVAADLEETAGQEEAAGLEETAGQEEYAGKAEADGQTASAGEDSPAAEASMEPVNEAVSAEPANEAVSAEPANEASSALRALAANVEGKIAQMKLEVFDNLDEGYGDSQMLSSGDQRLLIDTDYSGAWGVLNDWLNSRQYTDFDIYISHYHDDHMGNVENILNDGKYKVKKLYLPDYGYMTGSSGYMKDYIAECESMMSTAKKKGVEIVYLAKGSIFNVGDITAQVLWGTDYKNSTHNTNYINNNSLVTKFTCGSVRYLNAGDIEKPTENDLLNNNVDVSADIFKLNHHGGDTSNKYDFIKAVNAAYYYYTYCEDSPTRYSPYNTWSYDSVQNAKQFGNVASVRYNGNIVYNVYDNVITQELERNCSSQTVYIYDKDDPNRIRMILTQDFNNASTKYIDDRAYGGHDYSTAKRDGSYAEDGWLIGNGEPQYYYIDNQPVKGWLRDGDKWYYLNPSTAKKEKGWLTLGGYTYFLNERGEMQTGFVKVGAAIHHFNEQGHQTKAGWAYIDGKWRYFGSYNKLMLGWNIISGKWYYLAPWDNGAMVTGLQKLDGKNYCFNSKGVMVTGWQQVNGKWYYFAGNGAGKTGWQKLGGKWYYLSPWDNGAMVTGLQKLDGKTYYFNTSGAMTTGWQQTGGKWYYFDGNGAGKTGWQKLGGKWYYLAPWSGGAMQTGWQKLDGKWYFFNTGGAMQTGWLKSSGKWYYLNSSGAMATGWKQVDGKWYYLAPWSGGAMQTGWQKLDGRWYYFGSGGVMVTGRKYIDGKWYNFSSSGAML